MTDRIFSSAKNAQIPEVAAPDTKLKTLPVGALSDSAKQPQTCLAANPILAPLHQSLSTDNARQVMQALARGAASKTSAAVSQSILEAYYAPYLAKGRESVDYQAFYQQKTGYYPGSYQAPLDSSQSLIGAHAGFSKKTPKQWRQKMIQGKDIPRTIFAYPRGEIKADEYYGEQWLKRFASPNSFETSIFHLTPGAYINKTYDCSHEKLLSIDELLALVKGFADQGAILNTNSVNLAATVAALEPEKTYILDTGESHPDKEYAIVRFIAGMWQFNQSAKNEWQALTAEQLQAKLQQTSLNSLRLFEITQNRLDVLGNYLRLVHREGTNAAQKRIANLFAISEAEKQQELKNIFRRSHAKIQVDGVAVDMAAERVLLSLYPDHLISVKGYKSIERIELIDALLLQGKLKFGNRTFSPADNDSDLTYYYFRPSESQLSDTFARLDNSSAYLLRTGHKLGVPCYHHLYFEAGIWYAKTKGLSAPGEAVFAHGRLTPLGWQIMRCAGERAEHDGESFVLVRASKERLLGLSQYVKDYRELGALKARENAGKLNPNQYEIVELIDETPYQAGKIANHFDRHFAEHSRNLLPANLNHKWLAPDIPSSSPAQFALNDPFLFEESARFNHAKINICADKVSDFLSYMYGLPPSTVQMPTKAYEADLADLSIRGSSSPLDALQRANFDGVFSPLNQSVNQYGGHYFDKGYSEQGVVDWLDSLDRRLPYLFNTNIAAYRTSYIDPLDGLEKQGQVSPMGHIMALFFYQGAWHVYNHLTPVYKTGRVTDYVSSVQAVSEPIFCPVSHECIGHKLSEYGRQMFCSPHDGWKADNRSLNYLIYTPIDRRRCEFLKTYMEVHRIKGDNYSSTVSKKKPEYAPFYQAAAKKTK